MRSITKLALALLPALLLQGWGTANATETIAQPPSTTTAAGPQPSTNVQELARRKAPSLSGRGEVARRNALAFIDWAGASTKAQDGEVRKMIAKARANPEIVSAICEEAFRAQQEDNTRALVALSLVGETKSPRGMDCLAKFISQPLPEKGTMVDGEILEQTALAMLQAKAIDGLAYFHDEKADRLVIEAAAKSPSRIVRAEAITAYLWNHNYDEKSQDVLKSAIRKDEIIFMDRLVKQADEPKDTFNRKLATYLQKHPDLVPPIAEKTDPKPDVSVGQPPKF